MRPTQPRTAAEMRSEAAVKFLTCWPAVPNPEVAVGHLKPMTRADIYTVFLQQPAIKSSVPPEGSAFIRRKHTMPPAS